MKDSKNRAASFDAGSEYSMDMGKEQITIRSSAAEYLTYVASTGEQQDSIEMRYEDENIWLTQKMMAALYDQDSIEMRYEDENIWLTQKMMAALYDVTAPTINEHIKKVFADSELQPEATIRKFRIVQSEGARQVSREVNHYSLQMIIAVGFKVNSERAVQFRKWVNQIAKEYTIKGWVMDDERLKRGTYLTDKYFEEQLERVREIQRAAVLPEDNRPLRHRRGLRQNRGLHAALLRHGAEQDALRRPRPHSGRAHHGARGQHP